MDRWGQVETGPDAVARLRAAFAATRHAMLIADDQRRYVTANTPACELLGIAPEDVPWRRLDDFTLPEERSRLDEQWEAFLESGAVEGWYELCLPTGSLVPVEFSATANVLPGRHLSVYIPRAQDAEAAAVEGGGERTWTWLVARNREQMPLSKREHEVLELIAAGAQNSEIAGRLVVSPETVKSHVQNAMKKLGARTRAHAVAIGLRTGQIDWTVSPRRGQSPG